MVSKNKVNKSISISRECETIINENFDYGGFGKWVEEIVFNTFTSDREKIEKELKELNNKKEFLEEQLKERDKIDLKELEFMRSAKERLNKDFSFLEGIIRQYYNLFGVRVTKKYFIKRMNELLKV